MITNNKFKLKNAKAFTNGLLLSKIFNNLIVNLESKINSCFTSLDNLLFDLAEKSDSNVKQVLYLDSMQLIRHSKDAIINDFLMNIKSVFESYQIKQCDYFELNINHDNLANTQTLELVDNNDLDITLTKSNLINKSEAAYHKHLFIFKKCFAALINKSKLNTSQTPVGPFIMVHAFEKSINDYNIKTDIKMIMYKSFERSVLGHLNETYVQINDLLIKDEAVPEIKYNIKKKTQETKVSTNNPQPDKKEKAPNHNTIHQKNQRAQGNNAHSKQNNVFDHQNLDQNYQLISQLLNLQRQSKTNATNKRNNINTNTNGLQYSNIDLNLVINAVLVLQNNLFKNIQHNKTNKNSPTNLKDDLFKQLHEIDSSTKNQRVKQIDEDTIDLVGLLFQFIVDDRNLPNAIQSILAKLQLPYLRIALKDRNLFADKNHEARLLLDKLALASVGWSQESDHNNQLITKIKEITHHILETREYNNKIFEMLLMNFDSFLLKLKKKEDITLKRTQEKTIGEEKIKQAKDQTAQLLVHKMTGKQLPVLVRNILLNEWSSVLILMYLRSPQDSNEFNGMLKFVDDIVEYSQPHSENHMGKEDVDQLICMYKKGLQLVVFQQDKILKKSKTLSKCLNNLYHSSNGIKNKVINADNILKFDNYKHKDSEIIEFIEKAIKPVSEKDDMVLLNNDEYVQKVSKLKVNMWLEFSHENSSSYRAKLSWISPSSGSYLFVNSRGYKIIEKTSTDLVDGFRNDFIHVLLQDPLFDRALYSIAQNLNKKVE